MVLRSCDQVSKLFRYTVQEFAALQYKVQCHLSGVVDAPFSIGWDLAKRSAGLAEWVKGWRSASFSQQGVLESLSGGIKKYALSHHTICHEKGPNTFNFIQIPSESRGIPRKEWQIQTSFSEHLGTEWLYTDLQDVLLIYHS